MPPASTRFRYQLLLAWLLLLAWGSILCIFLEGKSSTDLAFTLWDDRFARLYMEPMGSMIMPQMLFYLPFVVITVLGVTAGLGSRRLRGTTRAVVIVATGLLLAFTAAFGTVQATYLGGRQGPTGWALLQWPWLALLLFCAGTAAGVAGAFVLLTCVDLPGLAVPNRENPETTNPGRARNRAWTARALLFVVCTLGALLVPALLIEAVDHVNAAIIAGLLACGGALVLLVSGVDLLPARRAWLARHGSSSKFNRPPASAPPDTRPVPKWTRRGFLSNPENTPWRLVRAWVVKLLAILWVAFGAGFAYARVPDEWVFPRTFELLPWLGVGLLAGVALVYACPDPAVIFPLPFLAYPALYAGFLADRTLPMSLGYLAATGVLLGLALLVLVTALLHSFHAADPGRLAGLLLSLGLTSTLAWILVCVVDRFQYRRQMVQRQVTAAFDVLFPALQLVAWVFLIASGVYWAVEYLRRRRPASTPPKVPARRSPSREPSEGVPVPRGPGPASAPPSAPSSRASPPRVTRRGIWAVLVVVLLVPTTVGVNVGFVYENTRRPLLARIDAYSVWTVPGHAKVERTAPVQTRAGVPLVSAVNLSAVRGEWEGFHLLLTPHAGTPLRLTNVTWTALQASAGTGASIPAAHLEPFLVWYEVDEQPDRLTSLPGVVTRAPGEHVDLYWRLEVPRDAPPGQYTGTITLSGNGQETRVTVGVHVHPATLPRTRHLRSNFGGGWQTPQWFDELARLRISQYHVGIPFEQGAQYWWNESRGAFEFNWTAHDAAFAEHLARGFTGTRYSYAPARPDVITNDTTWAWVEAQFMANVSAHLEARTWVDEFGTLHSWVEIPFYYITDEPATDEYPAIKARADRYHARALGNTSRLRTMVTEEFRPDYPLLHDCIDIWCPVIGVFDPTVVPGRHAAGQQVWFYVCVGPTAPYPNFQLWEPGHSQRLIPYLCARHDVDGYLYWRMNTGNRTYRAGFDGNGDGQVAFEDFYSSRALPSLRLLNYAAGVEDYELLWLVRQTVARADEFGVPAALQSRAAALEARLADLCGTRLQEVDYDVTRLEAFRADLLWVLDDLAPYTALLYAGGP